MDRFSDCFQARYSVGSVTISEGDCLVLYSDGLSEAMDHNGQEFGDVRIKEIAADSVPADATNICGRIMDRVTTFSSADAAADDRTLVVVKFFPPAVRRPSNIEALEETLG